MYQHLYRPLKKPFLHVDVLLLLMLLVLSAVSLVILYSASNGNLGLVWRQAVRIMLGFGMMVFIAQFSSQQIERVVPWLYLLGVFLLVMVAVMGTIGKGAQRWLDLGFIRFQPSELVKLTVPMMVAWYLADKPLPPRYKDLFIALLLLMIPAALVVKQPDLGTSLLIASAGGFVILLAGLQTWLIMSGLGLAAGFGLLIAYTPILEYLLHPYQLRRVETFIDPEKDPLGAGYHIIQSKIAIGSGGLFGKGLENSTQSRFEFLPERTTDFIFAVFGEAFGLLGFIALILLYLAIITRGLYIAIQAQGMFARLLAGSITLTFFVYIFVNIGMVTGLLPVVGVPLPLISYGGTSIVTLFAGFGLLMSVHTHKRLLSGQH